MNLHSIKFAVEVEARLLNPDHSHAADVKGHKVLDWKLGLGPCGRWVDQLTAEIDMATLRIRQTSYSSDPTKELERVQRGLYKDDGALEPFGPNKRDRMAALEARQRLIKDRKIETFIYKLEDVRGRIKAVER
ncbi:hypothetical protein phiIBB-PF7Ap05 [Pseudomonas phage phiIBB-PF7A]|uniref:Uncharacterized protein n=1 Tax=Pseudomonas phage phiIBB-PF7A TaxID=942165 RepID=E9KIE0_9CAUD|nr:hypothetical protein phiIBB-PF7Ap05 [Pseudomonas phage phiIBB-PF7A]ADV35665.1 hypothetical protein phiIBB-PF7Ap05 [Pseudomonas phage phiIBB-PF7A]